MKEASSRQLPAISFGRYVLEACGWEAESWGLEAAEIGRPDEIRPPADGGFSAN